MSDARASTRRRGHRSGARGHGTNGRRGVSGARVVPPRARLTSRDRPATARRTTDVAAAQLAEPRSPLRRSHDGAATRDSVNRVEHPDRAVAAVRERASTSGARTSRSAVCAATSAISWTRRCLTEAIHASGPLLEPRRTPRQLEVNDHAAAVMKVQPFRRGVGREQDPPPSLNACWTRLRSAGVIPPCRTAS